MSVDTWQWVADLVEARSGELQERYAAEIQRAADTLLASGHLQRVYDNRGQVIAGPGAVGGTTAVARSVVPAPASVTWRDPTLDHIRVLRPDVAQAAFLLVRTARLQRLPVWISSSIRSAAHQTELVAQGRSLTNNSLHVRPAGQVAAFDIDLRGYHRDRVPARIWQFLGALGESLGLQWGGRWTRLRDLGHFQGTGGFSSGPGF